MTEENTIFNVLINNLFVKVNNFFSSNSIEKLKQLSVETEVAIGIKKTYFTKKLTLIITFKKTINAEI